MTDKKFTDEEIIKVLNELSLYTGFQEKHTQVLNAALDLINKQKEEIDRLKEFIVETRRCDKEIKSEAIKEFAEKLKEKSFKTIRNYGLTKDVVEVSTINNLLKEMVGENNG